MLIEAAGAASSVLLYSPLGFRRRSASLGGRRTATPIFSPSPNPQRLRLSFVAGAADSTQPSASASVASTTQKTVIADNDFSLAKVSPFSIFVDDFRFFSVAFQDCFFLVLLMCCSMLIKLNLGFNILSGKKI